MLRALLERNLDELRGEKLKRYADTLDAMLWAYLAWHCWRWGEERNDLFGTPHASFCARWKPHGSNDSLRLLRAFDRC